MSGLDREISSAAIVTRSAAARRQRATGLAAMAGDTISPAEHDSRIYVAQLRREGRRRRQMAQLPPLFLGTGLSMAGCYLVFRAPWREFYGGILLLHAGPWLLVLLLSSRDARMARDVLASLCAFCAVLSSALAYTAYRRHLNQTNAGSVMDIIADALVLLGGLSFLLACGWATACLNIGVQGPRAVLPRLWRGSGACFLVASLGYTIRAVLHTDELAVLAPLVATVASLGLLAAFSSLRTRVHQSLAMVGEGISAAAGIAELLGEFTPQQALAIAAKTFRAVPLDKLRREHLEPPPPSFSSNGLSVSAERGGAGRGPESVSPLRTLFAAASASGQGMRPSNVLSGAQTRRGRGETAVHPAESEAQSFDSVASSVESGRRPAHSLSASSRTLSPPHASFEHSSNHSSNQSRGSRLSDSCVMVCGGGAGSPCAGTANAEQGCCSRGQGGGAATAEEQSEQPRLRWTQSAPPNRMGVLETPSGGPGSQRTAAKPPSPSPSLQPPPPQPQPPLAERVQQLRAALAMQRAQQQQAREQRLADEAQRQQRSQQRVAARQAEQRALFAVSQPAILGEVDVFVSHSWDDDPDTKWEALQAWRRQFVAAHGREPLCWFDRERAPPRPHLCRQACRAMRSRFARQLLAHPRAPLPCPHRSLRAPCRPVHRPVQHQRAAAVPARLPHRLRAAAVPARPLVLLAPVVRARAAHLGADGREH